jgi:ABC-2 type transport system ATP-binding protein
LDPASARSLRDLIKSLRAGGRTIFLTTHNLPEAEELCGQIAIMNRSILMMGAQSQIHSARSRVRLTFTETASRWVERLRQYEFVNDLEEKGCVVELNVDDPSLRNPALIRSLAAEGANLYSAEVLRKSLEEIYLSLIAKEGK